MSKIHYNPDDLPPLGGQSPIAEIFPFRTVMPAVYVAGCNLRCLYCINRELVNHECPEIDAGDVVTRLRNDLEPWIMVSGAEPLMHPKTPNLLSYLKFLGFNVALATNGSCFKELKQLIDDGMIDHVAIDVKVPLKLERYAEISPAGVTPDIMKNIIKSVEMLRDYPLKTILSCHFRTTVCGKYIDFEDLLEIAGFLGPESTYVLQYFTTHQTLSSELADDSHIVPYETLVEWSARLERFVRNIYVAEV